MTRNAPFGPVFLIALLLTAPAAPYAADPDKPPSLPSNFTATFVRSVTSEEDPGKSDITRGKIYKLDDRVRFELNPDGRGALFVEIYDLKKKRNLEINFVDQTVAEKPLPSDMIDVLLNSGFPVGSYALAASPDEEDIQCGRDAHYTVTPRLDADSMRRWEALKAHMYVCLSKTGLPSLSAANTIEEGGKQWKNVVTFENVQAGAAKPDAFEAPADFKKTY